MKPAPVSSIGSFFGFVTVAILVLVLTFLMLVEGPEWRKRWFSVYQDQDRMERHMRLADRMHSVVTGYVTGQLTVSAIGATAAALVVFALSLFVPAIPSNLAMPTAAITFVLSLIPIRAMIGGIIVTLLLAFNSIAAGIFYLIFFIVYQQIENNFIALIFRRRRLSFRLLPFLGR